MSDLFQEPDDATPLVPAERDGLKLTWITTRADLNAAEQDNIDAGAAWAFRSRRANILTVAFSIALHRQMFGQVWDWAGHYRTTERNIGIAPYRIGTETAQLFDDAAFWVANETYEPDELAVRLHHRLVFVHPFPNGNGRHARMMADLLIRRLGAPPFSWGSNRDDGVIHDIGDLRKRYVSALRAADGNDYEPLIAFARS
ncbi:mobile mystery protein B [uncultured Maricaulis sp.]|uniref:mobile mystery protein B n=1 Tax=uncultured Maricaulis sp. TaxID=174710 RepID=UPI00305EEBDB|tara:strand:+ start:23251 stop:23850 length:600 start_codon:yes stop_codon:yes gene_type:complete